MQSAVEQIKDRLPITDVLASYLTLIPAGNQYKAKCPFHNERTASFSISPDRGLYYCFGCGVRGDIFTFVQEFEGVDFNGALKILADRAGVELRRTDRKTDDLAPVYELLEKTTQHYQNELQKNTEALRYLEGRGITKETIEKFRIGYAPSQWRFVANTCATDTEKKIAERAGLIKKPDQGESGEKKSYDRFRGRIMFPLTDSSGRVIGFSGRMFPDTPEGPKYLNSPETDVFQKSRVLYGFDKAKFHIKRHGFAILVEGQMDLLMSHQAGFRNTVATSGTAVSEQSTEDTRTNLVTLSRLVPHLFLAFDGDTAGQKALARAALVALSLGMNPKAVPIPSGIDPAEYLLQHGSEQWKALLAASEHFIIHQARAIRALHHSPHMLVRTLRESVFPYLSNVASPVEQNLYTEAIAKELGLSAEEVAREHARFVADRSAERSTKAEHKPQGDQSTEALSPHERFTAFVYRFSDDRIIELKEKIAQFSFEGETIAPLTLDDDRAPSAFAIVERDYGMLGEAQRYAVARELAEKLVQQFFAKLQRTYGEQLRDAEAAHDEALIASLLARLASLSRRRQEYSIDF